MFNILGGYMGRKTKEEILKGLKVELIRLGSTKRSIYDSQKNMGQKSSSAICRSLNMSWREVVLLIGLQPQRQRLTKNEQLKALKEEFERIGSYEKRIYTQKRNKDKFFNPDLLCKMLDMSWYEITKECGRKNVIEIVNDTATDEELIEEYKQLSNKLGKPLSVRELQKHTKYTYEIYRQHFGTISKLRLLCGYEVIDTRNVITKDDCVQELIRLYQQFGRKLTYKETKNFSSISMSTIIRRFNTTKINEIWNEILDVAL